MKLCPNAIRVGTLSTNLNIEKDMKVSFVLKNTKVNLKNVLLGTPKHAKTFQKSVQDEKIALTDMRKTKNKGSNI